MFLALPGVKKERASKRGEWMQNEADRLRLMALPTQKAARVANGRLSIYVDAFNPRRKGIRGRSVGRSLGRSRLLVLYSR